MAFINHVTFSKCLRVVYSCSKQLLEATKANMRHQRDGSNGSYSLGDFH